MIPNEVPDSVSAIRFLGNAIAETRTEVQSWMVPSAARINLDSLTTATGRYRALGHVRLDNAFPVVEGYEDAAGHTAVAAGMRLNFSDWIGTTALTLTSSYAPDQGLSAFERFHASADFHHWGWRISAALNRADFYDLFGPTKRSRRGYSLAVRYQGHLLLDGPRSLGYTLQVAGYGGLETVPEYQNVAASFDKLLASSANLAYGSLRRSLGAIDDELGTVWGVTVRGNYVNRKLYPRVHLDAATGWLLPWDHSSLWFRVSAGTALAGDRTEPFASFFFGGFGNNWVDYRAIRQFRETEAFPGLEINQVGGANYGRAQVEWTLPPLRFRRVGIPSFYLRWAGLSFFATGLVTDIDDAAIRGELASVGGQLDFRLVTLSHLDSTLSVGYAWAWGRGLSPVDALMVSFKIM
jgi:hypothetical protein